MRADTKLPIHPARMQTIDIDAAGTVLGGDAFVDVWNCFAKDDGTFTRRAGLRSHHEAFDASGSALNGEGLSSFAALGLFQFDRIQEAGNQSTLYLAKVDDYIIGSRFGNKFDLKLAKALGLNSIPDFVEVYSSIENKRYLVVCTNDRVWNPSYWSGRLTPSANTAYDIPAWGYFKTLKQAGYQAFGVFHNNRLFLAGGNPFQIIYSTTTDFRDFANGGAFAVNPQFGKVTGFFKTFFGELIVGQERAISRVSFSGGVPVSALPLTTEVGLVNNRCSVQIGNDYYFIGTDGQIHSLTTTLRFGDILTNTESWPIYRQFDEGPATSHPHLWAVDDWESQIAWFGISRGSGNQVDICWGMDYARKKWLRLANDSIKGPSCAALWRMSRYNGRQKIVFGSYATSTFAGGEKGRIWSFTNRHKEDVYLASRTEAVDSNTPAHLQPRKLIPPSGGASGWPDPGGTDVVLSGTYSGGATGQTTILLSAAQTGLLSSGLPIRWEDKQDGTSGTITSVVGSNIAIGSTGISIKFSTDQTVTTDQEIWILIDRGYRTTETFKSGLFDDFDFDGQLKYLLGSVTFRNFVPRLFTGALYAGDPSRDIIVESVSVITRVSGAKADNVSASDASRGLQSPFRWSLDVLFKADGDRRWSQVALLDGNSAQQNHLDESLSETTAGAYSLRPDLQFVLGATQASSGTLVDELTTNIHRVKIDRRCKTFRLGFGQWTMAANAWSPTVDDLGMYQGDFTLVGFIPHVKVLQADVPVIMGEGDMSKTWEL